MDEDELLQRLSGLFTEAVEFGGMSPEEVRETTEAYIDGRWGAN